MQARQTHIRRDRAPADRPAKSGATRLPPAPPMLGVQRTAGNRAAATVARRALQRLDDDDLAAIKKDRKQKQELERIQKKYNDNFVNGDHSNYHRAETWHYWFKEATSLPDLDKKITDLIKAAVESKARSVASAKPPGHVPPPSPGGALPSSSSPVVTSLPPSPSSASPVGPSLPPGSSSAAPAPKKREKKEKKFKKFEPPAASASTPKKWGPGMNSPGPSPSAYKPPPLPSTVDARNADVAGLIQHQPPGAVRVVGPYWMTDDTIYFSLTVTEVPTTPPGLQQPIQRVWDLEIHYHPVPKTSNYLHVKMRAGTSAQNVLPPNNWLVDRAVFQAAVTDWNNQKPDQSPHTW